MKFFVRLTVAAALLGYCGAQIVHIKDVDDFMNFTSHVNNELINFKGTTVLLETDLDMSDVDDFVPIGSSVTDKEVFSGVFDGQGHHIGNLTFESVNRYFGLFGNTNGATIRNVIIDDTCTFTNKFVPPSGDYSTVYVGGIVGYCATTEAECKINNCVSHATIVYKGNNPLYGAQIGGIIGMCHTDKYDCIIKDCINTGHITSAGIASSKYDIVGGIVGSCVGESTLGLTCNVSTSVNTGGIEYSSTTTRIMAGGIAGVCGISSLFSLCTISNCVSDGTSTINVLSKSGINNVGGIVGFIYAESNAKNSYWSQTVYNNSAGYDNSGSVVDCTKYNGDVQLAAPWKYADDAVALTSGELIRGLAEKNMMDKLKTWITSTYTINFVTETYDYIKPKNMTFLESISTDEIVPNNPSDEVFGGWFVSAAHIYEIPSPCVLRNDTTIYAYWTTYQEIDAAPLSKPLQLILSLFIILHLFF